MTQSRQPEYECDVDTAVVTGATGSVGSWVVDRLADDGVSVVGLDLTVPAGTRANAEFREIDLTEQGPTWETLHEVDPDVVVHLAAISDPLSNPDTRVFETNVASTYNTLSAAGRLGTDVVWTSSQAAFGALFAESAYSPDYLPIDECHDRRPEDAYGLSKVCSEEIARTVARRDGVAVTTIRPATVFAPDHSRARPPRDGSDLSREERAGDFGSYVDVRDLARMVGAVVADQPPGYEEFLCVADENYLGQETTALVETICGEIPAECALSGKESALSNAKAKRRLEWSPEFSWETGSSGDVSGPEWV
jgi:nucleoside-diphosphate-sugar epimerase